MTFSHHPAIVWQAIEKLWPGLTLAVLFALFTSGTAQALTSVNQTGAATAPVVQAQKDTLVVGSEQDYPPFATGMTDATAGGFTVDLWRAVAAEADLSYTIRVLPFHQILKEFQAGKIDVLINLAQSDERHQFADFTVPHVIVHGAIFVRKGQSLIRSEDDLANKSIIVINADLVHDYAVSKGWEKQLILVDTAAEGMQLLASGKYDAMLLGKLTGMQTLQELKLINIEALKTNAGVSQKFAFVVQKGQSDLLAKLNEGLALTKSNGTYDALYNKWFGVYEVKKVGLHDVLEYLIPITVFFLGIVGYVYYRRQVDRKRSEARLVESEAHLQAAQDYACIGYWELWRDGRTAIWSKQIYRMFGLPPDFQLGPENLCEIIHVNDCPVVIHSLKHSLATGVEHHAEYRIRRHDDGTERWVECRGQPVIGKDGLPDKLFGFVQDITERKLAEEKLHLAASVFSSSREGIMITEPDGTIIDTNDAFTRITGYERDEVIGRNPRILSSGRQGAEFYTAMWHGLLEKGHWYGEIWNRRKNGEVYAEMQTISTVRDGQGNPQHYVSLFSDITSHKEHQSQLEHIAHYDALTSLPNRVLLADRLHQGMAQALRREQLLAVVYLDLDGFKAINDLHGHEVGDQLLIALASRMKQALREGDTLSRLGGDEFVAVLIDLADAADSEPMLSRLLAAAAQPVHIDDLVLQVSASVGVTFYPQADDVDADQLLRQADQAMYQAKLAGKNRYHVFDAAQDRSVRGHHESQEHIHHALSAGEFVLYYQPKVNMRTGVVIGAEALIRWQHPERGLLPPAMFLPVIEDHPLSIEIGEWVIATALRQMALWRATGLDIPVSVNVGARQLQQPDFVDRLREILAAHPDIRADDLEIEVLETSALEDLAQVSQVIEACREFGVNFALDDFGTGYSSLTYLKLLPVTLLKIDQSFVRDMLDDPDDMAILEGVVGLAAAFSREVIAEGVETVEHGEMLLQLGCELAQGYGIARPMPAHEMPGWAATWRTDPSWDNRPAVSRDNLPLLFASAEHRAWIVRLESYLKGERGDPPPLAHDRCRFGRWLESEGIARYETEPAFQAIEPLHQQVHKLAAEQCELHATGRTAEALAQLDTLHGLRDALLEALQMLVRRAR